MANGWYIANVSDRHFYTVGKGYKPFGECLCFIAELKIGDKIIETDGSWLVSISHTTTANLFGSEDYDATFEPVWQKATVLTADKAPKGELLPISYPPIKVKGVYEGEYIGNGLYYLKQNMSGMIEVSVSGDKGDIIKVSPFERLDKDGNPIETVNTYSLYTLKQGGKFYKKFTFCLNILHYGLVIWYYIMYLNFKEA